MRASGKSTFALFFGNRGFFPGSSIAAARQQMVEVLGKLGHKTLVMGANETRHGAVETPIEGEIYARWLAENNGKFDGVILSLPNFGDENGAVAALRDAGVPILIQAYPDDLCAMAPDKRRDSFCGKFSIMDVFHQCGIKFTALKPHVVTPEALAFAANVDHFDRVCRIVKGLKRMVVGAIGARTSAFKTVRIDELALQRHGITVETFDLSDVFARVKSVDSTSDEYGANAEAMAQYTDFSAVPPESFDNIVRLAMVLDQLVDECKLDAIALRCWLEIEQQLKITPCVVLSEMNDRFISAACEVDVGNAIVMHTLSKASGEASACLDWNNNYGEDEEKCILFHCGPVPESLLGSRGQVVSNAILEDVVGRGCTFGCNVGRIKPMPFTLSSLLTEAGNLRFYLGKGEFTSDPIPDDFFGCAGVAHVPDLQDVLLHVGRQGHRHHVSVTPGHWIEPLREALGYYLGFGVDVPQGTA